MRGFYSHLHGLILLLQMANFETVLWSMLLSSPLLHGLYIMDDMGNVDVCEEGDMDLLPVDLLAHIFVSMSSFRDLAQVSAVCKKWRQGVNLSMLRKERLTFSGWNVNDESTSRIVGLACNLKKLDISRNCSNCQISDDGLYKLSLAKCISNLSSLSLCGMTGITDKGVMLLVTRATSLEHLNIGGTLVTDESLFAIANSCPHLKTIDLWSCRHITGDGLVALVKKCTKLEFLDVWGMRIPVKYFFRLLSDNPQIHIKPGVFYWNVERLGLWPVF